MIEFSNRAKKELVDGYGRAESDNNRGKIISLNYYGRSYTTSHSGDIKEFGSGMMMIFIEKNKLSSSTYYKISIGSGLFVSVGPKEVFDEKTCIIDFNGEKFSVVFH